MTQTAPVSKKMLWAGRIISALAALFLLFDSVIKVMKLAPAVEGTARLGYPASLVRPIGIAELICVLLFVIPRTSILGAILLTGYLGGAIASHVARRRVDARAHGGKVPGDHAASIVASNACRAA